MALLSGAKYNFFELEKKKEIYEFSETQKEKKMQQFIIKWVTNRPSKFEMFMQ